MSSVKNLEETLLISVLMPRGDDPQDSLCRWGAPSLFWGAPGIGKTQILRTVAQRLLLPVETLYAGTRQPEDFSGTLIPDGKGGGNSVCTLAPIRRLMKVQEGILFLDEISCAPPAVQGAMLSLALEGNVGDDQLPPGIRILGAANPADEAAGGWDLEPPSANRFLHFEVSPPTVNAWIEWYTQSSARIPTGTADHKATLLKNWDAELAKVKGSIAGFMKVRGGDFLHALPPEGNPNRGRAWPSGRTWELGGWAMTACRALKMPEHTLSFLEASVGAGAATEYAEWLAKADLPDPQDMLDNGWTPSRQRPDIALAAYTSLGIHVTQLRTVAEKHAVAAHAWRLFEPAFDGGFIDLARTSAELLANHGFADEDCSPDILKAAQPVLRRLARSAAARVKP